MQERRKVTDLRELNDETKRLCFETLNIQVWIDGDNVSIEGVLPPIVSQQSRLLLTHNLQYNLS